MSTRDPRLRTFVPPTTTTTPAAVVAPNNPSVVAPIPTPGPMFLSTPKPSHLQSFDDDGVDIEETGSDDDEDMEMETNTSDHIQSGFGTSADLASVADQAAAAVVAAAAMTTMLAPKIEEQEVMPTRVPTPVRTMDPSPPALSSAQIPAPTRTMLPAPPPHVKSSSELVADIHSVMQEEREELTRVTQRLFALFHRNGRLPQDAWPEEDRIAVLKEQETKKRIMEGFQNLQALIEGMDEITKSMTRIAPTLPLQEEQALAMDAAASIAAVDIQEPLSAMTMPTFTMPTATPGLPTAATMEMEPPVKKKRKTNKESRDAAAAKQQKDGSVSLPSNNIPTNNSNTHLPQPHPTSPLTPPPPPPPPSSFVNPPPGNSTTTTSSHNNINNSNTTAPPIQKANPAIHANRNLLDDTFPRYQRYPKPPIQPHNQDPKTPPTVPAYKIMSRPIDFLIALKQRAEEVYGEDFEYAYGFIISQATLDNELRALFELDFEYPNMSGWLWTQYEQRFVELALTPEEKQQEAEEYALIGRAKGETFAQYGERLHRWSTMYRIDQLPNIQKVNATLQSSLPDNILMVIELRIVQRCIMRHLNMPEPDAYGMMGVVDICQALGSLDDALDRKKLREASGRLKGCLEKGIGTGTGTGSSCSNGGGSAFKGPSNVKSKPRPPAATAAPARPRPAPVSYAPSPSSSYPSRRGEVEGYNYDGYTTGYTGYESVHHRGASHGYDAYRLTPMDYGTYTSLEAYWPPSWRGRDSGYPPRGCGRGGAGASRGRGAASAAAVAGVGGGPDARGVYGGGHGGRGSRGSHGFAPYPPRGGGGYSISSTGSQ